LSTPVVVIWALGGFTGDLGPVF